MYKNLCLEKHQPDIIKKKQKKYQKSCELYQNRTKEKITKIKNMPMINIGISQKMKTNAREQRRRYQKMGKITEMFLVLVIRVKAGLSYASV